MRILLILFLALMPLRAAAQDAALLVADELYITRARELVASGNVEAFQNGVRLRASMIRYDQDTGALSIEGPITLTQQDGTVITATAAELDADLRNGILKGARLVLNQQLQLAAFQIDRVDGRYSQLYKTAVTSCHVCDDGSAPLWQIRAKRVVYDALEEQLYFDEAQFRIGRVPVFWLPRLRLPGPTVERASGFLVPSVRTTSNLGIGIKVPYFLRLSEKRDLTLTPYLSSSTKTLEFRYRQAYRTGRIQFDGAFTRDDIFAEDNRGYLFGRGLFALPRDYTLYFAIEAVSDDGYLDTYGYSDADRLRSELTVSRARRDEYVRASFYNFQSLRDDEPNETLPTLILDGEYERRFFPRAIGGEVRARLVAHSHRRLSDVSTDEDGDGNADGRDVARLNAQIDWLRSTTLQMGLRTDTEIGIAFNTFNISQDDLNTNDPSEVTPHAAFTLRYPLSRSGSTGVSHVLEPVVQLSWTGGNRLDIPNEESTLVEFDQGNLLSLSRFPRADRRERGTMAAFGVGWSRFNPTGWDAQLSVGQVFRKELDSDFTTSSGLDGLSSDILLAGQISSGTGISFTGRSLFQDDLSLSKAEVRGDYAFKRGRIGGSYIWLQQDLAEDRTTEVSELTVDGSYRISNSWTASANWRYDVASDLAATAGAGLRYENECVTLDLSVKRRYTTSTSVEPSTDFGFNVGLRGFSADTGTERYVSSCSN
ncbi:LPS-assembly protein LptD [Sulfitobacter guttiformis]|uniref:LPS-assembly protein LptD n=1 Tax=Sulfitobacter guttiformis TaxID=74349 RepID=A0A420DMN2_9RHOB|nr:LPS assembly protein LptD [Sulfitobacter guttiformis]KIN72810.1 Organic solvent tolerance protein [Sulfitobacter guttiformis KCTC 32187]RKE95502.1 LPS-assembly protein [Sulfitobacter guttiformis]